MRLGGMQKTTLLDFPGNVACTVFTSGCNFRCPFCHNSPLLSPLPDEECFDTEEFFAYLEKRKGILDGVAITGGEPLLQNDIAQFIRRIKSLGLKVKLDTNGSFPDRLEELISEKLIDYIAMDVKSPLSSYKKVAGTDRYLNEIVKSIALIKGSGTEYEFRTTVVKELHAPEDMEEIGKLIEGAEKYFIQVYKDTENVLEDGLSAPSEQELYKMLETVKKYVPNAQLRGI